MNIYDRITRKDGFDRPFFFNVNFFANYISNNTNKKISK